MTGSTRSADWVPEFLASSHAGCRSAIRVVLAIACALAACGAAGADSTNQPASPVVPIPIHGWRAYTKPDGAMKTPPGYPRSPFTPYRDIEDWQFLADAARRTNWYHVFKYIPLAQAPHWFLTLGGEAREKYEYWDNWAFGLGPQDDNGYFLQRYLLHADAHLGPNIRFFAQMQAGFEDGRDGGPRQVDRNDPDLLQGYLDLTHHFSPSTSMTLRCGRQELAYGSARLLDARENANVRQPFDGFKAMFHFDKTEVDFFATRVVTLQPHRFDSPDPDWNLWGVYFARELPGKHKTAIDGFYLGFDRSNGQYFPAKGEELRHTLGARYFGVIAGFDFEVEGGVQIGNLDGREVRAGYASAQMGYLFKDAYGAPRIGLAADLFTGDNDPNNDSVGTFHTFFPRAPYWDEAPMIGQQNLVAVHPRLTWRPIPRVTLNFSPIWYWRHHNDDGIYSFGGAPLVAPNQDTSTHIGMELFTKATWQINDLVSLNAAYQHFFAASFIDNTIGAGDSDYVASWLTVRF